MCSVTQCRSGPRLVLTMNRDEMRSRHPEIPPKRHFLSGTRCWIGPCDGDAPNTWIAISDSGFGGCLLNRYQDGAAAVGEVSRGTLLPAMLAETAESEVEDWLRATLARRLFSPFTLITFGAASSQRFDWTGSRLLGPRNLARDECVARSAGATWTLITSSSWRSSAVIRWRRAQFQHWIREGAPFRERIPAFHLLSPPHLECWAPLMSRCATATRSITQIDLDSSKGTVDLRYWGTPHPRSRVPTSHLSLLLSDHGSRP